MIRPASACLLVLPLVGSPASGQSRVEPELRQVVHRLGELMLEGIETRSPNGSVTRSVQADVPGQSVFGGSFDWHSSLFAHWALLVMARTEGDDELEALLLARLSPEALSREREIVRRLDSAKLITFPYDQGWLLLVLAELERHLDPVRPELRDFRAEVEGRLLDWLETSPFPENTHPDRLGGRPYVGFYRSWLFTWLQVALAGPLEPEGTARLAGLADERIAPNRAAVAAHTDPHEFDFLWLPAILAIVEDLGVLEGEPSAYQLGGPQELPDSVSLSSVHVLGIELTKLWGLAVHMRQGDREARDAFHERLDAFLSRHDLWEEDFQVVTHWIPQFLWFAFWVADGRP